MQSGTVSSPILLKKICKRYSSANSHFRRSKRKPVLIILECNVLIWDRTQLATSWQNPSFFPGLNCSLVLNLCVLKVHIMHYQSVLERYSGITRSETPHSCMPNQNGHRGHCLATDQGRLHLQQLKVANRNWENLNPL